MSQSAATSTDPEQSALDWVAVAVAVLLAVVYLQLGRASTQTVYFAIAAGLLGWVVVFFSRYWQPVLYLPAAILTTSITVFWLVIGSWVEPLHQVTIVLNVAFLATTSYLLIYEDPVL